MSRHTVEYHVRCSRDAGSAGLGARDARDLGSFGRLLQIINLVCLSMTYPDCVLTIPCLVAGHGRCKLSGGVLSNRVRSLLANLGYACDEANLVRKRDSCYDGCVVMPRRRLGGRFILPTGFTSKRYPSECRLQASKFIQLLCHTSVLTLQMFISYVPSFSLLVAATNSLIN